MMGNMVGAGIFIYPSLISTNLPHPSWFLLIWLIGGFVALTGALSSAELGSVYPEVGVTMPISETYMESAGLSCMVFWPFLLPFRVLLLSV